MESELEREDLLLPIMTRDQRFDVLFAPIPSLPEWDGH